MQACVLGGGLQVWTWAWVAVFKCQLSEWLVMSLPEVYPAFNPM